jgi:hypothetical protein
MYDNIKSCVLYNDKHSNFFLVWLMLGKAAYNETKISINIWRLASSFSFTITSGHPAKFLKWSFYSFKNTENKKAALNILQSYCDKWKLTVNVNKTKVLVFSKRKCHQNFDFTLNGEQLDVSFTITSGHPAKFLKWSFYSFKNTENKKEDLFSPYLTSVIQEKSWNAYHYKEHKI